jgi:hypothetical protein
MQRITFFPFMILKFIFGSIGIIACLAYISFDNVTLAGWFRHKKNKRKSGPTLNISELSIPALGKKLGQSY